jgi:diguanylate cyclase (GGDEF)-like protein
MVPDMQPTPSFSLRNPSPQIRRELVELLYTSLPQVAAISATAVTGAIAMAVISGDIVYAVISGFILVTATVRIWSLLRYRQRAVHFSDDDVIRWERFYGIGAAAFGVSLGMLSLRALQSGDAPGAWLAFGLSMSFCVGMVSRAAIRPWIVLLTAAVLLMPTVIGGFMRPELAYKIGAGMLLLFWVTLREASRHLSTAFIERIEAKHALARQANQDFLTGLPNRAAFLSALQATTHRVAIIAIDLDGFKQVNDRHGHHAGDDLLRQVAVRLTGCIGEQGMASRFGGDEFMLLVDVDGDLFGREVAEELARTVVLSLSMPYLVSDIPVRIGASAGILVTEEVLSSSSSSMLQILEQVDRALYAAKRAGGGRWTWSTEDVVAQRDAS